MSDHCPDCGGEGTTDVLYSELDMIEAPASWNGRTHHTEKCDTCKGSGLERSCATCEMDCENPVTDPCEDWWPDIGGN